MNKVYNVNIAITVTFRYLSQIAVFLTSINSVAEY